MRPFSHDSPVRGRLGGSQPTVSTYLWLLAVSPWSRSLPCRHSKLTTPTEVGCSSAYGLKSCHGSMLDSQHQQAILHPSCHQHRQWHRRGRPRPEGSDSPMPPAAPRPGDAIRSNLNPIARGRTGLTIAAMPRTSASMSFRAENRSTGPDRTAASGISSPPKISPG